jgi:hypothetical protein
MALGRELHDKDRFHLHRRSRLSGPFRFEAAAAAPRVLISREAVPYRPNRGVHVAVEAIAEAPAGDPAARVGALCAAPGVAGAWSFADETRRITVAWLDAPPLDVCGGVASAFGSLPAPGARTVFAGPFETITPWEWDWFDAR